MEYILETNDLKKQYKDFKALNGLTMHVPKGSIYGFVGKNGAGKTTLIRLISGLQKPTSGDFKIYGISYKDNDISNARKKMGAVVETPSIFHDLTAYENIRMQYDILGIKDYKTINDLDGSSLIKSVYTDSGLFIADSYNALLLSEDFTEIWSASMPENLRNQTINQLAYLKDDYLLFCSKNWSMAAYHTRQTTSTKNTGNVLKKIHTDYSSFAPLELAEINYYLQGDFLSYLKDPERISRLKQGNYKTDEEEWLTQTLSLAKLYHMDALSSDFGTRTEKSVFQTDSAGFETILVQLALLCTDQTQNAVAAILSDSNNKLYCRTLLANLYGYDPDGKLLEAIERNAVKAGNKDSAYLNTICDAVYSICLFMGRPAWNKKGKQILKSFMGAGYSYNTRTYARDTLKKIIALEL